MRKSQLKLSNMTDESLSALQKSEERFRTIFKHSRDAILLTDENGRIIEINQAGVDLLGYKSQEELMAMDSPVGLFEKEEDFHLYQDILSREGYVTEFEARLVAKLGRVFDALATSSVINDAEGQINSYVVIIRDITKRKKAQQQADKQNIRLAALNAISMTVNSSLDLIEVLDATMEKIVEIIECDSVRIYMLDKERGVLNLVAHKGLSDNFVSKSFVKSREVGIGILGQTVVTCNTTVVDNFLRSQDPYVEFIVEEGLQSTVYIPLVSKGNPVGAMCVSSHHEFKLSADYVEFLTAIGNEIGLAINNADLYENIKKAYQELTEAQERVIQTEKLASLGKLAATIAHEINNPLAAVLTYIRLMMKIMKRGDFIEERLEDISRYLATMESETARCGDIVKNLLAFSRHSKITIENNHIEKIIDKALILITHELQMRKIKLVEEIEPNLPEVRCDFKQIQQALLAIMINASEAMTEGGILTLAAKRDPQGRFLEIVISDTGCGISEEDLKNVFEPFFTTKEEAKGVGLGLSVVYGIIIKHNGFIDVESEIGKGTTFRIRLPVD